MPDIIINIPDAGYNLLQQRYAGATTAWLNSVAAAEVQDIRTLETRKRVPELMRNDAFVDEIAPIVKRYLPA